MRKKYILFSTIIIVLVTLLLIIGLKYKLEKHIVGKQPIVNSFELYSNRINCVTIKLNVYEDKETENIETRSFKYDITKILKYNHQYEDANPTYILTSDNGEKYNVYSENKYLLEFLEEININLDTCLEYKY